MRYAITFELNELDQVTRKREWRAKSLPPSIDHHGYKVTADNLRLNRFVRNVVLSEVE